MNPSKCVWTDSSIPLRGRRGYVQHLHIVISMERHPSRRVLMHQMMLQGFQV